MSSNGTSVATTPTNPEAIQIARIEKRRLIVPIVGETPLITHRFSEKAKKQMLDNMRGVKNAKQPKDPDAEYEAAAYRFEDGGYGIPVISFKLATVGGARFYSGITMTALKQFIYFKGEIGVDNQMLARIDGDPELREDVVRVGRGGTDLRYRPEFWPWSTELIVEYIPSALTKESVLALIDAGGSGVGVGEWRTEKNGDFGAYRVDYDREIVEMPVFDDEEL